MEIKIFDRFRQIVYEKAGISINANKIALVAARVGKRMRELSFTDEKEYLAYVLADEQGTEIVQLLDVISTNVTSFFRESNHFEVFGNLVADWFSHGQRKFTVWCAAASTGEEPYTIGMTMLDKLDHSQADIKILATDISTRVLAKCNSGCYPQQKVEPVPPQFRKRFFTPEKTDRGVHYSVKQELRDIIRFARLNLSQPPFPMHGPLDAVFCRNVMIYFDNDVRKKLLDDIYRLVKKGGYLFVGHAESLTGILSGFTAVMPSVYIKQ